MTDVVPKLSIITPSLNTGHFLEETIASIRGQSYTNYEHIVVDGGSTDGTLEILKKYPEIRVIIEKGSGYWGALDKACDLARGEYVMNCAISDGYLDMDWFRKCVDALDADKEVSLVWGLPQYMDEAGNLLSVSYPQFHDVPAPQKKDFFYYWLASSFFFPEGNLCARKEVFRACLLPFSPELVRDREFWVTFAFNFNTGGYLPRFLPTAANYGRIHAGQGGQRDPLGEERKFSRYLSDVRAFRRRLWWGRAHHIFRDGAGNPLSGTFSRTYFLRTQVFSFPRGFENLKSFAKRSTKRTLIALNAKGLVPGFLKKAIVAKQQEKIGITK